MSYSNLIIMLLDFMSSPATNTRVQEAEVLIGSSVMNVPNTRLGLMSNLNSYTYLGSTGSGVASSKVSPTPILALRATSPAHGPAQFTTMANLHPCILLSRVRIWRMESERLQGGPTSVFFFSFFLSFFSNIYI